MKIALVGYGKMGHMLEIAAKSLGHEVVVTIDSYADDASVKVSTTKGIVEAVKNSGAEGIIEFTHPSSVIENIKALVPLKLPLVIGTTGWYDKLEDVKKLVKAENSSLFYSPNYSIGVNMFYKMVEHASSLMSQYSEYDCAIWEAHHNQKADSPSGTALAVAKSVMAGNPSKTEMVFDAFHKKPEPQQLHVSSTRCGSIPGTHKVFFDSPADTIEITHQARSREGFAMGAVRCLNWLDAGINDGFLNVGNVYTMKDFLG
ncbi:MAG: 4-hydroxy-tetrahydrodipicolinate reductase [Treponema sp. CETP13]|nr:MAG: 4-hydroxy-tetrahydrodipicolinate reductase [Treponema sp. CETP13]